MKKTLFIFLMAIATCDYGYSNDSLKIVTLQREVSSLKSTVSRLQQENGKIRGLYEQQMTIVDSISDKQKQQSPQQNEDKIINSMNN